jgi:hypothetical protein
LNLALSNDCSWTWRKLLKLRTVIWDQIEHVVGNGEHIFLWWDLRLKNMAK